MECPRAVEPIDEENKHVIHVTKEGARILQSKEAEADRLREIKPKPLSLAARVWSAVSKGQPFVTDSEEEAMRVCEAEAEAQEERDKREELIEEGVLAHQQKQTRRVKAVPWAVSELLRSLHAEHTERGVDVARLQSAAFRGHEVEVPEDLAMRLERAIHERLKQMEAHMGKDEPGVRKRVLASDKLPEGEEKDRILIEETPGAPSWDDEPGATRKEGKVKVLLPRGTINIDEEIARVGPASATPGKPIRDKGERDRKAFVPPMMGPDAEKLLRSGKHIIYVTVEGAAVLMSKEEHERGTIPPKPDSLASRVMAAAEKGEPFITETEEEAMAIWEAEAHAEEHREKKRRKEGSAEVNKPMVKVKVDPWAVSELMKALQCEQIKRGSYLARLQSAAYKGWECEIPEDLARRLEDAIAIKPREKLLKAELEYKCAKGGLKEPVEVPPWTFGHAVIVSDADPEVAMATQRKWEEDVGEEVVVSPKRKGHKAE